MRQFNRILGFVAVGFVLLFVSKVSKTSLYTAYFKTITDVEIRNSHAIAHADAVLMAPLQQAIAKTKPVANFSPSPTGLLTEAPVFAAFLEHVGSEGKVLQAQFQPLQLRCLMDVAPRAPGA
jgi:hypothetical protein